MLIHTAVIFAAGSGSILAVNAKAAFGVDLLIMGTAATVIYSTLFRKTGHNVLYVLLIGTVLNSFSVVCSLRLRGLWIPMSMTAFLQIW